MRRVGVLSLVVAAPLVGFALMMQVGPAAFIHAGMNALDVVAPRASAQTTLEFKRVPPESVSTLERGRAGSDEDAPAPTSPGAVPPVPPVPPAPPVPPVTRAGDVARFGNDIHVTVGEVVRGDITAMGGTVTVDGTVHGDIAAIGGDVYLNPTARVEGDVVSVGGTVHEQPGAYVSGKTMTVAGGAPGAGFGRRVRMHRWREGWRDEWDSFRLVNAFVGLVVATLLTLLVVWLFPSRVRSGTETARRHPATSIGIGALVYALFIPSVIALVIVVALLCITIIGIPLALAALLGYFLFFVVFGLFGLVIGATLVGEWLARKRGAADLPLWQVAVTGALLIVGARFIGRVFQVLPGVHWLGTLVVVLTVLVMIVLGTLGGGAWLKWEFGEGLFGRWRGRWESRRQPAMATAYGPPPGSPYGPAAAPETPPAPAPASPPASAPEAYMPPTPEPPPSDPTPGT
jgi:hypothetical protein